MNTLLEICMVAMLFVMGGGVVRIVRGPTPADRLMAAQLFASTGVAILLMQSVLQQSPSLQNIALFISLLATVTTIAFVRLVWLPTDRGSDDA